MSEQLAQDWQAEALSEIVAAVYDFARYDDLAEPVGGCPNCDPVEPEAFNAVRLRLYRALSDYDDALKLTPDAIERRIATIEAIATDEAEVDEVFAAGLRVLEADAWRERLAAFANTTTTRTEQPGDPCPVCGRILLRPADGYPPDYPPICPTWGCSFSITRAIPAASGRPAAGG